jgi:prepilin-type N-terminal cleavage/methylation domain-containing protein
MLISSHGTLNRQIYLRSESGFTLLEIVIVVSVLALFVGLAVPRLPDIAGTRIHQNARKVSNILKLARSRAVSLRRYYRVEMDLETNDISISYFGPEGTYIQDDGVRLVSLREGIIVDVVSLSEGKVQEGTGMVRISPRGFIEPALVHIKDNKERFLTVVPSPVSGRVQVHDGYMELSAE